MQSEKNKLHSDPLFIITDLRNAEICLEIAREKCGSAKSCTDYLDTAIESVREAKIRIEQINKNNE